ncbi:ATPase synthesis protein 25 mitochondrial [Knufia peltigerae]|uniref:ATPase synthesis protein 25 n=1 Tax=Knufia peltigerae TaxID=1002370 RepID=A0AA38Y034_9EURO|nr:ATPase synthesis protein 25 mitochondrial [Knufia peltigerae]
MHRTLSLSRCISCRRSVLEAFTSLAGINLPARNTLAPLSRPLYIHSRTFSHISPLRQSLEPSSNSTQSEYVPWYLEVEDPEPPVPTSPLLALQEIPPLPDNPPQILSSVLDHLSTQIGLDNLTLLDLRHIDPPPALGANLIMVIGTARSVKHLNVSADRFCRWARKEYKLRPFADGLLGRNELKLKLRRKARRMKLAQSVGNTMATRDSDDGITTGWICVNMGPVDEAVLPEEQTVTESSVADSKPLPDEFAEDEEDEYINPPDDYVGFGSRINSPRIVVQMFTEQKRLEMDLEGLWDVRNTRRARKANRANAAVEEIQREQEEEADDARDKEVHEEATKQDKPQHNPKNDEDVPSKMEKEIEQPEEREGTDQSKPMGSIGAS